jgi:hypothetical protein
LVKALSVFEVVFVKGKRTADNIFITKTTINNYLRFKRARLCWCFVDFKKAFDSTVREVLRYKMRRKGVGYNTVNYIKEMDDGVKFCVRCGEEEVADFFE